MVQDTLSNKLSIIVYLVPAAEETLSGYRRLPGMWDANISCKATYRHIWTETTGNIWIKDENAYTQKA